MIRTARRQSYVTYLISMQDKIRDEQESTLQQIHYVAAKRAGIPVDADAYDRGPAADDDWFGPYLYTDEQRRIYEKVRESFYAFRRLPKEMRDAGWKYLGSGVSRTAYLGPDGLVYKVGSMGANEKDHRFSRALRKCPKMSKEFSIPDTVIIEGVLLMTAAIPDHDTKAYRYDGKHGGKQNRAEETFAKMAQEIGVYASDLHYDNLYLSGGRWTIVDMGAFQMN